MFPSLTLTNSFMKVLRNTVLRKEELKVPVYKTEKNGTWYVMVRYKDWKGERKQKCQRGFATKREAQE